MLPWSGNYSKRKRMAEKTNEDCQGLAVNKPMTPRDIYSMTYNTSNHSEPAAPLHEGFAVMGRVSMYSYARTNYTNH